MITWKSKLLQSRKYGRYFWLRLCARVCKYFETKNLGEHNDFCMELNREIYVLIYKNLIQQQNFIQL